MPCFRDLKYDMSLVERYRKALDRSVEIATNFNVPPISGVTLMLCNVGSSMFKPCTTYKGMGQPRQVIDCSIHYCPNNYSCACLHCSWAEYPMSTSLIN